MRRRGDLRGWILMGILFIGAMALIFYILLLRAQHLAGMEQRRMDPDPEARVVQLASEFSAPLVMHAPASDEAATPHWLVFARKV